MIITVRRFVSTNDATLSQVLIDGAFQCFGLEDEYRQDKVAAETRIPAGVYKVGVRTVGGFHTRYSAKFPDSHKGMLHVLDVPGFEYILIHIGNTEKDTAGCLLVGQSAVSDCDADYLAVGSSKSAYINLYNKVIEAAIAGDLVIHYIDED